MVLCYCAERSLHIGTTDTKPQNVSSYVNERPLKHSYNRKEILSQLHKL